MSEDVFDQIMDECKEFSEKPSEKPSRSLRVLVINEKGETEAELNDLQSILVCAIHDNPRLESSTITIGDRRLLAVGIHEVLKKKFWKRRVTEKTWRAYEYLEKHLRS